MDIIEEHAFRWGRGLIGRDNGQKMNRLHGPLSLSADRSATINDMLRIEKQEKWIPKVSGNSPRITRKQFCGNGRPRGSSSCRRDATLTRV